MSMVENDTVIVVMKYFDKSKIPPMNIFRYF